MNTNTPPSPDEMKAVLGLDQAAKRKRLSRKVAMYGLMAVAILGAGYGYYTSTQQSTTVSYLTQPVVVQSLTVNITATGTVQPTNQVDVGSEQSGIIKSVAVVDNSIVKKGDVLATLDVVRLEAQRAKAAAQVQAAAARLIQAKATDMESALNFKRQTTLRIAGLSKDQDLDAARALKDRSAAQIIADEADIQSAKADLTIVETDLAKSNITSPIDGIVLKSAAKPGQTVAASLQAPVLFTLADDLRNIQIEAAVDEADIGKIKTGQNAIFSVDAYRGHDFTAEVKLVSFSPDKTNGVVTYKAILAADNAELLLRPGMTTTAHIVVEKVDGALTVPNEALRYVPAQTKASAGFSITKLFMPNFPRGEKAKKPIIEKDGTRSLWVLRNGTPVEVKIKAGSSDGKITAVTSDELHKDDAVILSVKTESP
jgi:HlyD family secretion protein